MILFLLLANRLYIDMVLSLMDQLLKIDNCIDLQYKGNL